MIVSELWPYGLALLIAVLAIGWLAVHFGRMFRHSDLVLRELVGTFSLNASLDSAFDQLLSAIKLNGLDVQRASQNQGEVLVRCLTGPFDLLLWRCWHDKLLFVV